MTLEAGRRVRLTTELRLAGSLVSDADSAEVYGGSLSLAAGVEGTVERTDGGRRPEPSHEVREYERLKSLLDSFGAQMPPASRERLEEELASLEPAWTAHRDQGLGMTVRVRLDNGFVLDDMPEGLFAGL
ncbi:hypothetical protein ABZO31_00785 [Streptomyces sp. HUAS MG47]|uniref:hypothetical protein n=1 Tax=Streptomyces solicamelliae TaxID=3231716 RepID=UPI003877FC5E